MPNLLDLVMTLSLRGVSLVSLVLTSLFASLFVDGSSLLDAGIVAFEFDLRVLREVEDMFHRLTVA